MCPSSLGWTRTLQHVKPPASSQAAGGWDGGGGGRHAERVREVLAQWKNSSDAVFQFRRVWPVSMSTNLHSKAPAADSLGPDGALWNKGLSDGKFQEPQFPAQLYSVPRSSTERPGAGGHTPDAGQASDQRVPTRLLHSRFLGALGALVIDM